MAASSVPKSALDLFFSQISSVLILDRQERSKILKIAREALQEEHPQSYFLRNLLDKNFLRKEQLEAVESIARQCFSDQKNSSTEEAPQQDSSKSVEKKRPLDSEEAFSEDEMQEEPSAGGTKRVRNTGQFSADFDRLAEELAHLNIAEEGADQPTGLDDLCAQFSHLSVHSSVDALEKVQRRIEFLTLVKQASKLFRDWRSFSQLKEEYKKDATLQEIALLLCAGAGGDVDKNLQEIPEQVRHHPTLRGSIEQIYASRSRPDQDFASHFWSQGGALVFSQNPLVYQLVRHCRKTQKFQGLTFAYPQSLLQDREFCKRFLVVFGGSAYFFMPDLRKLYPDGEFLTIAFENGLSLGFLYMFNPAKEDLPRIYKAAIEYDPHSIRDIDPKLISKDQLIALFILAIEQNATAISHVTTLMYYYNPLSKEDYGKICAIALQRAFKEGSVWHYIDQRLLTDEGRSDLYRMILKDDAVRFDAIIPQGIPEDLLRQLYISVVTKNPSKIREIPHDLLTDASFEQICEAALREEAHILPLISQRLRPDQLKRVLERVHK